MEFDGRYHLEANCLDVLVNAKMLGVSSDNVDALANIRAPIAEQEHVDAAALSWLV
jgi:hypothetical protein